MSELKIIRENIFLLLFFWGEATVDEICAVLNLDEIQVLAALFVLKSQGRAHRDDDAWSVHRRRQNS